jgi:pyroglutamyl-peptidase
MRIIIAGFGPFPGAPFNPSGVLAEALARRRRPALARLERSAHVFATTYASVDRDLPKLLAAKPDILLIFGLAGRRRHVCIETRARNARSVLFPDAGGYRPEHGVVAMAMPTAVIGRAPFARLVGAARSATPARLSRDAGRYLCNYVYWRALEQNTGRGPLVQFVHIPAVGVHGRPSRRTRRRAPSLPQLIRAGEAILIALAAASRH